MEKTDILKLINAAMSVRKNAYAPYSGFYVGAALLCEDGEIFAGANAENSSYPAGHCAERAAFASALSAGKRDFSAIAIAGGKEEIPQGYCMPCGICRQLMSEFCTGEFLIICVRGETEYKSFTLDELLPGRFSL